MRYVCHQVFTRPLAYWDVGQIFRWWSLDSEEKDEKTKYHFTLFDHGKSCSSYVVTLPFQRQQYHKVKRARLFQS